MSTMYNYCMLPVDVVDVHPGPDCIRSHESRT